MLTSWEAFLPCLKRRGDTFRSLGTRFGMASGMNGWIGDTLRAFEPHILVSGLRFETDRLLGTYSPYCLLDVVLSHDIIPLLLTNSD